MSDITAIILTYNESKHLERCLSSVRSVAQRICVVDSFSKDNTEKIARDFGADFFQNPWKNHADQFSWAMANCKIQSTWTLRIDADEYLEPELIKSINNFINAPDGCNAAYLRRKIVFLNQPIKHGFFYPSLILRLWKSGFGSIEQRWMDEHVVVKDVKAAVLSGDLTDENLNDLNWWTQKHADYAMREVYEIIKQEYVDTQGEMISGRSGIKRFIKNNIYNKLPSGLRSTLYFLYRYFLGAGFLDGKAGYYFHFLQAYWYRTLVDAKLYELKIEAHKKNMNPYDLLKERGVF